MRERAREACLAVVRVEGARVLLGQNEDGDGFSDLLDGEGGGEAGRGRRGGGRGRRELVVVIFGEVATPASAWAKVSPATASPISISGTRLGTSSCGRRARLFPWVAM